MLSSPQFRAGLPARIEELRGHFIAVAAVQKQGGSIASFSNRCGIAADYCISAPGTEVRSAYFAPGPNIRAWTPSGGTSMAAPMVSGGLAVMKHLFRGQLSNSALVSRLFATANKTGIYADRSIYGQGLMDLGAATNPWGEVAFMGTGRTVAQQREGTAAADSAIRQSGTLGDSFALALAQREVAAFDALGAPFWLAAGDLVHSLPHRSATARLDRLLGDSGDDDRPDDDAWWLNVRPADRGGDFGHLALADGAARFDLATPHDWSTAFFHRNDEGGRHPLSGFAAQWRPADLPAATVQAGWLAEPDSLLGSSASGAFGRLAGSTAFLSARLEADGPAGWRLSAQGELGAVSPDSTRGPLIRELSTLSTSAFRLAATRALSRGGATLRLAVEQPVRVTAGAAFLDLPTGRTVEGRVVGETVGFGLAPSGRQLDLSARVDYPLTISGLTTNGLTSGALALESIWSRQPGHRADAPSEWTILAGWGMRF